MMDADVVTIAGHRCERGSDAWSALTAARWYRAAGLTAATVDGKAEYQLHSANLMAMARRAPGYLGPADTEGRRV